jgi:hypothetical protein
MRTKQKLVGLVSALCGAVLLTGVAARADAGSDDAANGITVTSAGGAPEFSAGVSERKGSLQIRRGRPRGIRGVVPAN